MRKRWTEDPTVLAVPAVRVTLVFLGLVASAGMASEVGLGQERSASAKDPGPCEGPGVDAWITDFRDRVTAYHGLARFAVQHHGGSTGCRGRSTTEFEGTSFGIVTLSFSGNLELEVETSPPETSVSTLRTPSGFQDEDLTRQTLRDYATDVGLAIDWTTREITTEGKEEVHTFWDPDPGLNASASLFYREGRLVAVRLSMAL